MELLKCAGYVFTNTSQDSKDYTFHFFLIPIKRHKKGCSPFFTNVCRYSLIHKKSKYIRHGKKHIHSMSCYLRVESPQHGMRHLPQGVDPSARTKPNSLQHRAQTGLGTLRWTYPDPSMARDLPVGDRSRWKIYFSSAPTLYLNHWSK